MIKVDNSYQVVLTYSPIIEITGHLFECFDYYLFLKDYYKIAVLLICSLSIEQLKIAWESKYIDSFEQAKRDFIIINKDQFNGQQQIISFGKNTVVILTDGNIKSLEYHKLIFSTTKLFGFLCEYDDFHNVKYNKNITYLMDYRVYNGGLKFFKSIDYVKKLPFSHYKRFQHPNSFRRGMMYVTYVCRNVTPDVILDYHERSGCKETMLVVPYKKQEFENIPNVVQTVAPVENFFNKFDVYIYTPVGRHFDCSPRLLTECFLHGKKVFCDVDYCDQGLYVRLNDCKTNFNGLNLKENDLILNIINNSLNI